MEPIPTATQLALSLFQEFEPLNRDITEAPTSLGFRRPDVFVDVADLSLVGRRAVDVAHFIVADDPNIKANYDIEISFFTWLMGYNSNNRQHLRRSLREAQKSAVQVMETDVSGDDPGQDRWVSVPLIGVTGIARGRVFFEVDQRIQKLLKSPETNTHFLSLRYVFKSLHAKILYDRLQPFVSDEWTPWLQLDTLKEWLGCQKKKTYDEYANFKRKVLDVAVGQINEVTNLKVSYLEMNQPGSRRVVSVRFRIERKTDDMGGVKKSEMLGLKELYVTLETEFALTQKQFAEILSNRDDWTDERIWQAIEYTRFHIRRGNVKISASGYLMKALRENYRLGTADLLIEEQRAKAALPPPAADNPPQAKVVVDAFTGESEGQVKQRQQRLAQAAALAKVKLDQEISIGLKAYELAEPTEREPLLDAFRQSMQGQMAARKAKLERHALTEEAILGDVNLRAVFGSFMHSKLQEAARG